MKKLSCVSCLCAVYSALLIFVGVLPLPKPYAEIVYGIFVLLQLGVSPEIVDELAELEQLI